MPGQNLKPAVDPDESLTHDFSLMILSTLKPEYRFIGFMVVYLQLAIFEENEYKRKGIGGDEWRN